MAGWLLSWACRGRGDRAAPACNTADCVHYGDKCSLWLKMHVAPWCWEGLKGAEHHQAGFEGKKCGSSLCPTLMPLVLSVLLVGLPPSHAVTAIAVFLVPCAVQARQAVF